MPLSIIEYLERGPSTSKEIQAATGLSQTTIARKIRKMEDRIIAIPEGRTVKYAAMRNAFNSGNNIPLSIIDEVGKPHLIAHIRPLIHGGFFVEPIKDISLLLLGESRIGLYEDLPYFLYDLRPQGFLGRQVAKRIASQCDDFPSDPRNWNSNHIGRYLISNGDDLPGNFIFGDRGLIGAGPQFLLATEVDYPDLAQKAIEGEIVGSSAGGEQSKFTAFNENSECHVIVKFSPKDKNEIATRWRDILITEYHAAVVLNARIFSAAIPGLIDINGQLFLESQRFDRIGTLGRRSMISLQTIDSEFTGLGGNWPRVMKDLLKKNLVTIEDSLHAESLWWFGRLINNSDMHLGNLSLSINKDIFRLLPIYDMCSMGFAPKTSGEVPPFSFGPPELNSISLTEDQREIVIEAAYEFWENVSMDSKISDQFRAYLQEGNPVRHLISNTNTRLR